MKLELVATATFGLEAVVRREIEALGYKVIKTEDGRVTYMGDERAIARSNLWLRSADRVYVRMGEFDAREFEELFQQTKALEWESIIPMEGAFPVVGGSVKSALHSVPACQSIVKKAVSVRLSEFYCLDKLPETGAEYRIRFIAHKDRFLLLMDTSGAGTIPVEAAMIARNIAPGLSRSFASEGWDIFAGTDIWKDERRLAYEAADFDTPLRITAMDIDARAVRAAKENADEAGVADDIDIIKMDMTRWEPGAGIPKGTAKDDPVVVISNLPYGRRIGDDKGIAAIYAHIKEMMEECPMWSFFLITSDRDIEKQLGRKADRRRKLYNGTIETQFYQFHGKRPPKMSPQTCLDRI